MILLLSSLTFDGSRTNTSMWDFGGTASNMLYEKKCLREDTFGRRYGEVRDGSLVTLWHLSYVAADEKRIKTTGRTHIQSIQFNPRDSCARGRARLNKITKSSYRIGRTVDSTVYFQASTRRQRNELTAAIIYKTEDEMSILP